MAEPTVMVRLYESLNERIDKIASAERRKKQDVLAMLVEEAIANRTSTPA